MKNPKSNYTHYSIVLLKLPMVALGEQQLKCQCAIAIKLVTPGRKLFPLSKRQLEEKSNPL